MKPPNPATVALNDNDSSLMPRYDVTSLSGLAAAATLSSGGGGRRTPTTTSRGATMAQASANASFLIAAVTENRAREIGICAIDLVAPYELLLWSIIDSHSYADTISLLHAYQPTEILIVETTKANKMNDEVTKRFSGSICRVVPVARKYFE
uniref:Uncharacterized protein n=1 Tax=Globisporangium ultimum (strain ATCC 200006 / CBS 805.95 / DAOM BR144) TaxID=431595 RepID=K3WJP8_GLOUD